jgi:hypothetical protein
MVLGEFIESMIAPRRDSGVPAAREHRLPAHAFVIRSTDLSPGTPTALVLRHFVHSEPCSNISHERIVEFVVATNAARSLIRASGMPLDRLFFAMSVGVVLQTEISV